MRLLGNYKINSFNNYEKKYLEHPHYLVIGQDLLTNCWKCFYILKLRIQELRKSDMMLEAFLFFKRNARVICNWKFLFAYLEILNINTFLTTPSISKQQKTWFNYLIQSPKLDFNPHFFSFKLQCFCSNNFQLEDSIFHITDQ